MRFVDTFLSDVQSDWVQFTCPANIGELTPWRYAPTTDSLDFDVYLLSEADSHHYAHDVGEYARKVGRIGLEANEMHLCGISQQIMTQPYHHPSAPGYHFEWGEIKPWVEHKGTHPITRATVCMAEFVPSFEIKQQIDRWMLQQPAKSLLFSARERKLASLNVEAARFIGPALAPRRRCGR